jgi:hypothetical protein
MTANERSEGSAMAEDNDTPFKGGIAIRRTETPTKINLLAIH